MSIHCKYPVGWTYWAQVENTAMKTYQEEVLKKATFFNHGMFFHYRLDDVFFEGVYPLYVMCPKYVDESVFKSLKFLYWVTGL